MTLPDDIIQRLIAFCESQNLGVAQVGSDSIGIHFILIGSRDFSPDQAAILAAKMLLDGVVTGGFMGINDDALNEEKRKGDPNVN